MINIYLSALNTPQEKNQFENLYKKYRQKMYKVAYNILHNVEDSEDAVHQAFLIMADNFEKIKKIPCEKIQSYIIITVRNISINIYNKNKKNFENITEFDDDKLYVNVDFFENIDMEALVEVISELPIFYKDVLFLHYRDGYTYNEISEMLEISIETVRKRIERAKKLLKEKLEKRGYYGK